MQKVQALLICSGLTFLLSHAVAAENIFYKEAPENYLPSKKSPGYSMDAKAIDVDNDGDLDIVIASEYVANVLYLNDGKGKMSDASKLLPQTPRDSEHIAIADFSGDKKLDIVVVSEDDKINEFYVAEGKGKFKSSPVGLPVDGVSNTVQTWDFNDDSKPDLIIGNNGQSKLLLNSGKGVFKDATETLLPKVSFITQSIALGDLDKDGNIDMVLANEDDNTIFWNKGDNKGFTMMTLPLPKGPEETRDVALADVDQDGDLDILFGNVTLFNAKSLRQNRLLLNLGNRKFTDETKMRLPQDSDNSFAVLFHDVDNDGDKDILTANFTDKDFKGTIHSAPYRVYVNDGKGFFSDATSTFLPDNPTGNGMAILVADFNGDGIEDLFFSSRGGPDKLLFGSLALKP